MKKIIIKILKFLGWAILTIVGLAILLLIYFNIPVKIPDQKFDLGVTFSARYAKDINLDWKAAYISMLDELKIRKIRVPVYWDLVEPEKGKYDFSDVDWQIEEAGKRDAKIILVMGQKVPRWPECFVPSWVQSDDERKGELLKIISRTVDRYKNSPTIERWQVENEPFLDFGVCPKLDINLLNNEINLVRMKDSSRPIVITDSGELSLWLQAASRADVFGTTMYRTIWSQKWGYYNYPIGPRFFQFKKWLIRTLTGQENAIVVELQGEPWINGWTTSQPLEEQFKSMDSARLEDNVNFAKKVGFPEIYVWGVEWWYWLKSEKGDPSLWNAAQKIFNPVKLIN